MCSLLIPSPECCSTGAWQNLSERTCPAETSRRQGKVFVVARGFSAAEQSVCGSPLCRDRAAPERFGRLHNPGLPLSAPAPPGVNRLASKAGQVARLRNWVHKDGLVNSVPPALDMTTPDSPAVHGWPMTPQRQDKTGKSIHRHLTDQQLCGQHGLCHSIACGD
ncbi:hypothetical protein ANANG_G00312970 [Anguilla anguilla]|uniref:Uncharacterized protein n=1 Tax=Anguilla anguilla TaxID=7936 RepID=A0A9D3LI97_ANGAN|nr:hypothetical protein ANANG_G00312970 [Anguilla anguilla]